MSGLDFLETFFFFIVFINWQLATGNWQLATGNWQLATGNWQLLTDHSPYDPIVK
jgi:hypothetical protein